MRSFDEFKEKVQRQIDFWKMVQIEADKVDLDNPQTVEYFNAFLSYHVDGWGNVAGPNVIESPLLWLADELAERQSWSDFCPVCGDIHQGCDCTPEEIESYYCGNDDEPDFPSMTLEDHIIYGRFDK